MTARVMMLSGPSGMPLPLFYNKHKFKYILIRIWSCIYLSTYRSACLPACLPVCLFIYLSLNLEETCKWRLHLKETFVLGLSLSHSRAKCCVLSTLAISNRHVGGPEDPSREPFSLLQMEIFDYGASY